MSVEAVIPVPTAKAAAAVRCSHCSLPVPAGLVEADAPNQFCCGACRAVWEAIHGCGLERYYELRDRQGAEAKQARTTGRGYDEFDDPTFLKLYTRELGEGVRAAELFLEGVHCVACVWLVEKLPELAPGVLEARLDLGRSMVRVVWDGERIGMSGLARALDRLGYVPHAAKGAAARDARRREDRAFLTRTAVAGALAGNSMLLAGALYFGVFGGIEEQFRQLFRWTSMALAAGSLIWPGRVFYKGALSALRARSRHLDLPIALGLTAGMVTSTINTLRGTGEVYFESISVLVFLLLCGRWIQHRQQRAATDSIELLYSLTPSRARLWEGGVSREVPIDAVRPGSIVEVRAEESFPADGEIVEGRTSVDQSVLTGESRPVEMGVGQTVSAGSVNLAGRVLVRVIAAGAETRVGRLMRLVEDAALRRAPIVSAADRIAGWFVVAVLTLSVITLLGWLIVAPGEAVGHALALLIVTCPCALGLATPLAVTAAIGRAARQGIMIKGGDVVERLARTGTILLDKTGTITEGRHALRFWEGERAMMPLVAALENRSSHPIAVSLVQAIERETEGRLGGQADVEDVQQLLGRGLTGRVGGRFLEVGSAAWLLGRSEISRESWVEMAAARAAGLGCTPLVVVCDGTAVAVAAMGDAVRSGSPEAVERLRRAGWRVRIVSGDDPAVVASVARQIGVAPEDAVGGASPEVKVAHVEEWLSRGPVVMVGDGVNDAAALARASVGVAVSGGAEASLAAADVFLREPGLEPVVRLCAGSRRTVRTIHLGLGVSLCYNVVGASLAMFGIINALIAAVLMPLSGLTVLAIAMHSRTFTGGTSCR